MARPVAVPGLPNPSGVWAAHYEVEVQETRCVGVFLSFVQVEVDDQGLGLPFGAPRVYDRAQLQEQSLSRLPGCGSGLVFRGAVGNIGGGEPRGPARVVLRAIGLDDAGNQVGLDWSVESPLQVER